MSERQETVDDIIAEMRIFKCRNLETGELESCNAIANYFADRLEAAHKRERGNSAALREALETLLNLAYEVQDANSEYRPKICIPAQFIIDEAKSALATPPRNCDVGTAEEQEDRFRRYCNSRGTFCGDCPLYNNRRGECRFAWAQMPYTEGGAK